jgi:putative alpha-1,2-mannosidase
LRNNAPDHPFVQTVRWNGKPHSKAWISHAQLRQGGRLVFEMGPNPVRTRDAFGALD